MNNFNQPLADIYKAIHPIAAKNKFVTYLNQSEKPFLEKIDLLTLKICVSKLKKLLNWKSRQILEIVKKSDLARIESFFEEIKKDNRTLLIVKKAICTEILKKIKNQLAEEEWQTSSLYSSYQTYVKKINWLFKSETRIIEYIIKTLKKTNDFQEKQKLLGRLKPSILSQAKDRELNSYAATLLSAWQEYYQYVIDRSPEQAAMAAGEQEQPADLFEAELPDHFDDKLPVDSIPGHVDELGDIYTAEQPIDEVPGQSGDTSSLDLPDFDEDDEAFLNRLAVMENAGAVVEAMDTLPENRQEDIIVQVSFDPRFDDICEEILGLKGDMGEFLGLVTRRVKEIEKQHGYQASEDFLKDLLVRIRENREPGSLAEMKIRNFLSNLQTIHERSTRKLQILKENLHGKNIINQVKVLQDTARDDKFKGIFGTVRNLERIALENHFDEIFGNLPIEIQKIIGDAFMADLGELKEYHPELLSKLETRVGTVENQLQASYTESCAIDLNLIDQILEFTGTDKPDSMEDLVKITEGILANTVDVAGYKELGNIMAGNRAHTPVEMLASLENQQNLENTQIHTVVQIMHEIEQIASLNEKISSLRFWIESKYYGEDPYILNFLQGQLEALEVKRVREGGLLRRIFDKLESFPDLKEKIDFLKTMLEEPEYFHLKPILKNLITNIQTESRQSKGLISPEFITTELEKLTGPVEQLNWLKTRRYLAVFAPYTMFIDEKISEIENLQSDANLEKMVDELTLKQARDSAARKKKQGITIPLHDNIISLAREVLAIDDKLERRKYIKEQEAVHPLAEDTVFQQQRRLLYILMNPDPGSEPAAMLQALAGKILLSLEEKQEYLKVLKQARYQSGQETSTLREVLGFSGDDIAYYAADIQVFDKKSEAGKLQFFEDFRNGKVRLPAVTYIDANGDERTDSYQDFFEIQFHVINKLIVYYKKQVRAGEAGHVQVKTATHEFKVTDTVSKTEPESIPEVIPGTDLKFPMDSDPGEIPEELPDEIPGTIPGTNPESPADSVPGAIPESVTDEFSAAPDNSNPESLADSILDAIPEALPEEIPEPDSSLDTPAGMPDELLSDIRQDPENRKLEEDASSEQSPPGITVDITKQESNGYKLYLKQKIKFDDMAQQRIKTSAKKYKEVENSFRDKIEEAHRQFKKKTENKLQTIIRNLNTCKPEVIPELISQTILPLLSEINDQETRDLIATLDQNLFSPMLYNGAALDVKSVVAGIESFLHRDGIFQSSFQDLMEIVEKIKKVREKYINSEVQNELQQITALKAAVKSGSIDNIFKNLLQVDPPERIVVEMQRRYLAALEGKPKHKNLLGKLELAKEIIITDKSINWGEGETFSDRSKKMITRLREKYKQAVNSSSAIQGIDSTTGNELNPVEVELISAREFVNPLLVIKSAAKANKIEMDNEAQVELVTKLFNEGKIFSYDRKHYIGYGKLFGFLNDKNNIGYSRNKLARELILFLDRFQSRKNRAGFIGVPLDQYDEFFKKIDYWSTHSDNATAGPKRNRPRKLSLGSRKPVKTETAAEKKAGKTTLHRKKKSALGSKKPSTPAAKKKTTVKKTGIKKSTGSRGLLIKLSRMITDKLLFLIKEYNSRTMLDMLYNSYLSPRAKKSDLISLVDKTKFRKLYDSIKDDKGLHAKLYFDKDAVKRALEKKMKRVRK